MLIPAINSKGIFRVKNPLDNLIRNDIHYTVSAIRNIKEILEDEIDVLLLVYLDQGLTKEQYNSDLENNVPIITLKSPSNEYFYIPGTFILSINDQTGVKYRERVIVINLGQIPANLNLEHIKEDLKDVVTSQVGLESSVEFMDVSQDIIYSEDEHTIFEHRRLAAITTNETCRLKLIKAYDIIEKLNNKVLLLAERLKNKE